MLERGSYNDLNIIQDTAHIDHYMAAFKYVQLLYICASIKNQSTRK